MSPDANPTAALLVIGDEILSGRTKDVNIGATADFCTDLAIDLMEVRVVADVEDDIVAAVNALRARYTYVFTTGGIGPTHDDITADAIAKAFGVEIGEDPRAIAVMLERYKEFDLTAARRRMARIPAGADLIDNPVSKAPGFRIGNVIVMAGVPSVMQAMLDHAIQGVKRGAPMLPATIGADGLPEGISGDALRAVAEARPAVSIGSYPSFNDGRFRNQIVVRSKDPQALAEAGAAVEAMLARLNGDAKPL